MAPSLTVKKPLRAVVELLESVLPARAFASFYPWAFGLYRQTARFLYWCYGLLRSQSSSVEDRRMRRDVFALMPWTLVGVQGLEATYRIAVRLNQQDVAGAFVECGVARGGCAALLCRTLFQHPAGTGIAAQARTVWLCDSFEGLPEPTPEDFTAQAPGIAPRKGSSKYGRRTGEHIRPLPAGSCRGEISEVKHLLLFAERSPADRVRFVRGWFERTLAACSLEIGPIALLRIDADWYSSTKTCLESLYDHVVSGGAVIIDDYQSCHGCKRAVDEFLRRRQLQPVLTMDGRGGCWFIKASPDSSINQAVSQLEAVGRGGYAKC